MRNRVLRLLTPALVVLAGTLAVAAADDPSPGGPDAGQPLPFVHVDVEAKRVEIAARVVNREVEWLELLLCTEGGREHETVLTTKAKPSHIHTALLLIGLEPGRVQRGEPIDPDDPGAGFRLIPAEGPAVAVTLRHERGVVEPAEERETGRGHASETVTADAGSWVWDRRGGETLAGTTWLFTGSKFVPHDGREVYVADFSGTLISLVHFGDDVLAPRTEMTNRNDEQALGCHTPAIPPVGTAVTVALTPADHPPPHSTDREGG